MVGEKQRRFGLAAGQHQLHPAFTDVITQCGYGIGTVRLFEHMQLFKAHAQISAQRRLVGVTGVQHMQVIPSQLQAQLNSAGIVLGTPGPPGSGVSWVSRTWRRTSPGRPS